MVNSPSIKPTSPLSLSFSSIPFLNLLGKEKRKEHKERTGLDGGEWPLLRDIGRGGPTIDSLPCRVKNQSLAPSCLLMGRCSLKGATHNQFHLSFNGSIHCSLAQSLTEGMTKIKSKRASNGSVKREIGCVRFL